MISLLLLINHVPQESGSEITVNVQEVRKGVYLGSTPVQ